MMDETDEAFESWIKALGNQYAMGVFDERQRIIKLLRMMQVDGDLEFVVEAIEYVEAKK